MNGGPVQVPALGLRYYAAPGAHMVAGIRASTPTQEERVREKLTLECRHEHVSIFDEVLNEPVGSLQLDLMALQSLSELRTVQERVAKLERRKPHGD